VLVVVHAVREDTGRAWSRLVVDRLAERGVAMSFLVWDRGMVAPGAIRPEDGPLREIEAINRWRLPQWLARGGGRRPARLLRNARLRWWWRRLGRPDAVLVLDPLRPEMRHYLPVGVPVGLLLTGRPLEPAEDPVRSVGLADRVVGTEPAPGAPDQSGLDAAALLDDAALEVGASPGPGPEEPLVVGLGPADWRAAPDLFVRVAATARARSQGPIRFAWVGMDPDDGRTFPYRHDRDRLGLGGRLSMTDLPEPALSLLRRAAAVVVTARAPHPVVTHPWCDLVAPDRLLDALGVPVVAFATPGADGLTPAGAIRVPYPDVPALADALVDSLDGGGPNRLSGRLDRLLDALIAAEP